MEPALAPFLNKDKERSSAVASSIGSHSNTTEVCVAFRHRRTGGQGEREPYFSKMDDWRLSKRSCSASSEARLRPTVMSTMEPEDIDDGSRMDGNSI